MDDFDVPLFFFFVFLVRNFSLVAVENKNCVRISESTSFQCSSDIAVRHQVKSLVLFGACFQKVSNFPLDRLSARMLAELLNI